MQIRETWEPILVYTAGIYLLPPLIVALASRLLREKLSERTRSRMDTFFVVWSAVIPCFAMIGFLALVVVTNSKWLGAHIVVATLVALFAAFIIWAGGVESDGITGTFFDTLFVGLIFFGALMFLAEASVLSDQKKAEEAARDAKFTQSVSYYLDANNQALDGETHTYPISNIGVNAEGDTYVWVEKRSDGTLTTRKSVKKVTDGHWEVVVKDDLPATNTEARVERRYEYALNPEEIAEGKEACVASRIVDEDAGIYPVCKDGASTVKFVKAEAVIHIPQGSAGRMLSVVD